MKAPLWRRSPVDGKSHAWPADQPPRTVWTAVCGVTASGDHLVDDDDAPKCIDCILAAGSAMADRQEEVAVTGLRAHQAEWRGRRPPSP